MSLFWVVIKITFKVEIPDNPTCFSTDVYWGTCIVKLELLAMPGKSPKHTLTNSELFMVMNPMGSNP